MKIDSFVLPTANRLVADYLQVKPEAMQFFSYAPFDGTAMRQRLVQLKERCIEHREELADGLAVYNTRVGNHDAALENIELLRSENTFVVIAGQQAGVMTGPLYTIYKAISILHTAKQLQEELGVTVVPVFWIAGEDHDLEEINHVWVSDANGKPTKQKLPFKPKGKRSASMQNLEREQAERFIRDFFAAHAESEHTQKLRKLASDALEHAATPVDWFARLLVHFFGKYGLVLAESSSAYVRKLEQPVFRKVLEHNGQISQLLADSERKLREAGYGTQLELDERSAHLFIYEGEERSLLEREGEKFLTKGGRRSYTKQELLELLEQEPERFSANVVSRPLAQEHLFPTLAFIGGPGEIGYWAYYKALFAELGYELPIVLPRTSITLVDGGLERVMEHFGLRLPDVLDGFAEWKEKWLEGLKEPGLSERFEAARQAILAAYQPLTEHVITVDPGLRGLTDKNTNRLLEQVEFLQERVERSVQQRHQVELDRIARLENHLIPGGKLQERVWSIFTYLNTYGPDLVDRLMEVHYPFDGTHKVVYL
ncbi:MAG: bacillithiol biosynthesis cysteine-adding enzyme BshC [Clostridia bacterium]